MPDEPKIKKRSERTASLKHERDFLREGYSRIVGLDEAGRGPLAGPVSAGAVALPLEDKSLSRKLRGVRDSKDMTERQRDALVDTIKEVALVWGIGHATPEEITELNILQASKLAMKRALEAAIKDTDFEPQWLFVDYMALPQIPIHQLSIVGGDKYSLSIAAASVLAKTWRDAYMLDIAEEFPQYGFTSNKGYPSPDHLAALKQYGPCPIHRMSFAPVQAVLKGSDG